MADCSERKNYCLCVLKMFPQETQVCHLINAAENIVVGPVLSQLRFLEDHGTLVQSDGKQHIKQNEFLKRYTS